MGGHEQGVSSTHLNQMTTSPNPFMIVAAAKRYAKKLKKLQDNLRKEPDMVEDKWQRSKCTLGDTHHYSSQSLIGMMDGGSTHNEEN